MFEEKQKERIEISMVPLINVVFLLLIFFLVVGTVNEPDILPIETPSAKTGEKLNIKDESNQITILLGKNSKIVFNDSEVSNDVLDSVLKYELKKKPNQAITVKADSVLPAADLIGLLIKVSGAGGREISIATEYPQ